MWKRAAKAQQPIAMYKLGHHLYKGDMNTLGRNVEDAVMWLTRFQRHVSENLVSPHMLLFPMIHFSHWRILETV